MFRLAVSFCMLFSFLSVAQVHADCVVGGTKFPLVGKYYDGPKCFKGSNIFKQVVSDKNGCKYSLPFTAANGDKIEGVYVESDVEFTKQTFQGPAIRTDDGYKETVVQLNFPVTDVYDVTANTTPYGEPTKAEYAIRYMLNGERLAEFRGTLVLDEEGADEPYLAPHKGVFTFANGEVWSLRMKNQYWQHPEIEKLSAESEAMVKKGSAATRAESKKATDEKAKQMAEFRRKAKIGSKVRVFNGGTFQAQGLITDTKKEMVKVQFTEQVLKFQWRNVKPFEQWVERSSILPPDGQSDLYK